MIRGLYTAGGALPPTWPLTDKAPTVSARLHNWNLLLPTLKAVWGMDISHDANEKALVVGGGACAGCASQRARVPRRARRPRGPVRTVHAARGGPALVWHASPLRT
jgi:hypothetical protein